MGILRFILSGERAKQPARITRRQDSHAHNREKGFYDSFQPIAGVLLFVARDRRNILYPSGNTIKIVPIPASGAIFDLGLHFPFVSQAGLWRLFGNRYITCSHGYSPNPRKNYCACKRAPDIRPITFSVTCGHCFDPEGQLSRPRALIHSGGSKQFYRIFCTRSCPVISFGWGRPRRASRVGATSARMPGLTS